MNKNKCLIKIFKIYQDKFKSSKINFKKYNLILKVNRKFKQQIIKKIKILKLKLLNNN